MHTKNLNLLGCFLETPTPLLDGTKVRLRTCCSVFKSGEFEGHSQSAMIVGEMSVSKNEREENHRDALGLMMEELDDRAIDTTFFNPGRPPFDGRVLRTTWEELERQGSVESLSSPQYRLTAKGWLIALEVLGASKSRDYMERLGRLLATMKAHVTGRTESAIVPLQQLAEESKEPEGWIFNVIDSRASSTGNNRTGAEWIERGRLVSIPVDFNLEPVDIASALTAQHLQRIQELEERLEAAEEDRAQFHCPNCDAPFVGTHDEDYPEYHCIVTYESFACGYVTADGQEHVPCPYGPNWPTLDEFEFVTKQDGNNWVCYPTGKTDRARRVHVFREIGRTKEEAVELARKAASRKSKDSTSKA